MRFHIFAVAALSLLLTVCILPVDAPAQSGFPRHSMTLDLAVGLSSLTQSPGSNGGWFNTGATFMFTPHFGAAANFLGRPTANYAPALVAEFGNVSFHDYLFDFDFAWRPLPRARILPEFQIGEGGEWQHFGSFNCGAGPGQVVDGCHGPIANHRAFHAGASAQTYFAPRWFVRAGFDLYAVQHLYNLPVFSLSLGHTFGPR